MIWCVGVFAWAEEHYAELLYLLPDHVETYDGVDETGMTIRRRARACVCVCHCSCRPCDRVCCVASIAFLLCLPVLLALVLALVVAQWFSHSGLSHTIWFSHSGLSHTISDLASLIVIDHEQQRPSIAFRLLPCPLHLSIVTQSHLDSDAFSSQVCACRARRFGGGGGG